MTESSATTDRAMAPRRGRRFAPLTWVGDRRSPSPPALIALGRDRLRRTGAARFGTISALIVAVAFAMIALFLRVADGVAWFPGLIETAAHWITWLAGGWVALAAAHDRPGADRADGLESLVASRGASLEALAASRVLAAMIQVAVAIGRPVAALALFTAAITGTFEMALRHLGFVLAVLVFAAIAGVTLGGVASACGRIGGARGRSLFAAVVIGPWLLADLAGRGAWSIPGALRAVLSFALRLAASGSLT